MSFVVLDSNFDWSVGVGGLSNVTLAVREDFVGGTGTGTDAVPETINFLGDVTLLFEGGSFSSITLNGNNTRIKAPFEQIFDTDVSLTGTFFMTLFIQNGMGQ
ncbi:MAG: hypothetical protein AAF617_10280 [Bacteroidota bacterium]